MTHAQLVAAVMEHVGPVTAVLDDTIAQAIAVAEKRMARYPHHQFPYLRPSIVRAEARLTLEETLLPDGWQVAGDSTRMGQLYLRKPGLMRMRLLKGNPLQPDTVPHAGPSRARREAWHQAPIGPELEVTSGEYSFLLLWGYQNPAKREEGFTLTLVHTLHPGRFGSRVPCDLLLPIPRGGTMFEHLKPFGNDEDVDLFATTGEVEIHDQEDA